MDRVNRAIQGTNDLEQMMSDVLDAVLRDLRHATVPWLLLSVRTRTLLPARLVMERDASGISLDASRAWARSADEGLTREVARAESRARGPGRWVSVTSAAERRDRERFGVQSEHVDGARAEGRAAGYSVRPAPMLLPASHGRRKSSAFSRRSAVGSPMR